MKRYFIFLLALITCAACSEEEPSDQKVYYGKVQVQLIQLPGTPLLELWVDEKKVSDIPAQPTLVTAGRTITLGIYKRDENTLLMDTTVTLARNELRSFKVGYSEEFGLNGWITNAPVSPDSMAVQFLNSLGSYFDAYPSLDLYVCKLNWDTFNYDETDMVIKDFSNMRLAPQVFSLPAMDAIGNPNYYAVKLKDPVTGEYIQQPPFDFVSIGGVAGGVSFIFGLRSGEDATITVDMIEL